jgi:Zn-dependent protease/CBS domain-containing protein
MGSSIKLFRIFGIDIGIHWSWIFIFFIVTWTFADGILSDSYPEWSDAHRWSAGALIAGVFFLSILAHELSHAVVSNRSGLPVSSITLFVFGGVSNLTREPDSAGLEFRIAIVGPLMSLLLGGLFAAAWLALQPVNEGVAGICGYLGFINASLAVFNMLPGFPLDGGRVFRSAVWARNKNRLRATHSAARAGEWIAYGIMAVGLLESVFISPFSGIWFLLIGFFLKNAAAASYAQLVVETTLSGIAVRDVMRTSFDTVAPDVSVDELVHDYVLRKNARCFAVIAAGDFAGLVTLTDVRKIPREEWPTTSVYRAMTPATRVHTVEPAESLTKVLQLMAVHDVNQLPVVQHRELVGMLDRADVMRFIQVHRDLDERAAGDVPASASEQGGVPTATPPTSPRAS